MGKSSINGSFSMAMLNNHRVMMVTALLTPHRFSGRIPVITLAGLKKVRNGASTYISDMTSHER